MTHVTQKADQIAYRFYTKLTLLVANSRVTEQPKLSQRQDKWFNLESPESDLFKDHLRNIYRSVSITSPPPPFRLQVFLAVPDIAQNQVLVHLQPDQNSRLRLEPTPRLILLESWLLAFAPNSRTDDDVAPSTIYKHGITLFRSLFSLLRILPAWKLFKRIKRRTALNNGALTGTIQLRVHGLPAHDPPNTVILGFDSPPAPNRPPLSHQTHTFPPIPHPNGSLSLSTTYLTTPNFNLDELESLLSSRFLSEGPEFTPTLAKNHHQQLSLHNQYDRPSPPFSTSQGSLPARTSLPKSPSPPSPQSSLAERFILPSRDSPRLGAVPLPSTTPPTSSTSMITETPVIHVPSSSAPTRAVVAPASGLASRLRRESLGRAGAGADLPSAPFPLRLPFPSLSPSSHSHSASPPPLTSPLASASPTFGHAPSPSASPLPIRRPTNPVHPFKSSTLSGSGSVHTLPHAHTAHSHAHSHSHSPSPSLRGPSPLSSLGAPSLPALPFRPLPGSVGAAAAAATTSGSPGSTSSPARVPHSPISGIGVHHPSGLSAGDRRASGLGSGSGYASGFGEDREEAFEGGTGAAGAGGVFAFDGETSPRPGHGVGGVRKRYWSSFGDRYAAGGGSEGSVGSGGKDREARDRDGAGGKEEGRERVGSASFLSTNTDDDDISVFVQDIDARKPLSGYHRMRREGSSGAGPGAEAGAGSGGGGVRAGGGAERASSAPGPGPMLTSELEVDERLRKMNDAFFASLEGLGGRRGRGRGTGVRGEGGAARSGSAGSAGSGCGLALGACGGAGVRRGVPPPLRFGDKEREEGLLLRGSGSGSRSMSASGQGSDEVIGRMELDDGGAQRE